MYPQCTRYCGNGIAQFNLDFLNIHNMNRDPGGTVLKVLCYKSVGRWFDPKLCQWIFHSHKILPIALWSWGRLNL